MEGSCQQDFPQDAGKLVRWARVPVGGNGSSILFWCKELFISVALQSCVYSSFIPGIFSVLFWCPCWSIQWSGIASNASLPLWRFLYPGK